MLKDVHPPKFHRMRNDSKAPVPAALSSEASTSGKPVALFAPRIETGRHVFFPCTIVSALYNPQPPPPNKRQSLVFSTVNPPSVAHKPCSKKITADTSFPVSRCIRANEAGLYYCGRLCVNGG